MANPKKYHSKNAFTLTLNHFHVSTNLKSIFSEKIIINEVLIKNVTITVSSSLMKTNIKIPMPKSEMNQFDEGSDKSSGEVFQECLHADI